MAKPNKKQRLFIGFRGPQEAQDEAQDGQDEAQDGQDEAQDSQDDFQVFHIFIFHPMHMMILVKSHPLSLSPLSMHT